MIFFTTTTCSDTGTFVTRKLSVFFALYNNLTTVISVDLWLDVVHQLQNLLNDLNNKHCQSKQMQSACFVMATYRLLVTDHSPVHVLNPLLCVLIDFSSHILPGTHVFRLKFAELTFAFLAILFDLILRFFLGLLQSPCFA